MNPMNPDWAKADAVVRAKHGWGPDEQIPNELVAAQMTAGLGGWPHGELVEEEMRRRSGTSGLPSVPGEDVKAIQQVAHANGTVAAFTPEMVLSVVPSLEAGLHNGDTAAVIAAELLAAFGGDYYVLERFIAGAKPERLTGELLRIGSTSPLLTKEGQTFLADVWKAASEMVCAWSTARSARAHLEDQAQRGLFGGSTTTVDPAAAWHRVTNASPWQFSTGTDLRPEDVDQESPGGIFDNLPKTATLAEEAPHPYFEPEVPAGARTVQPTLDGMMRIAVQDAYTMLTRRVLYEGAPGLSNAEKAWCQRAEVLLGATGDD